MDRSGLLGSLCACSLLACSSATGTDAAPPLPAAEKSESAVYLSADGSVPNDGEGTCESQTIDVQRIIPKIWFVIDGSGSMLEPLSADAETSRWEAVRSALVDEQGGVLKELSSDADVGLLLYDGPLLADQPTTSTACPRLVTVDPMRENFSALADAYTAEPLGGSTPTDKALDALIARDDGPSIVILATDGQPNDFCSEATPAPDVRQRVLDDVKKLAAAGHKLYVIALAKDDPALTEHLADIAAASGTGQPVYGPGNTAEIAETIRSITGYDTVCQVELSAPITRRQVREASVEVNGRAVQRSRTDGWRLRGRTTIEITGQACADYKRDAQGTIHVAFPCEAEQP